MEHKGNPRVGRFDETPRVTENSARGLSIGGSYQEHLRCLSEVGARQRRD
jgi:hypothetical protein